jgi:hypothetical protein
MKIIYYVVANNREINDNVTNCCGDAEHRPIGGSGLWYCMTCGLARRDINPVAIPADGKTVVIT